MDYRTSWRRVRDFFRRTPVHLRVASLLDHVGKNSPPDCFLPQTSSAPSLFESLFLFCQSKKQASRPAFHSGGELGIFSVHSRAPSRHFAPWPRRQKQSTGLFPSADCVCSLIVRIPLFVLPKKKAGLATCFSFWRRVRDSNPRYITYTAFRVLHLRPLGQLSVFQFVATCPIAHRNVYYTKHFYTCQ